MKGAGHLVAGQPGNDALNLPPVAKADEIVVVSAVFSTGGGLADCGVAEAIHQFGRVVEGGPSGDEDVIHGPSLPDSGFATGDKRRQRAVDHIAQRFHR